MRSHKIQEIILKIPIVNSLVQKIKIQRTEELVDYHLLDKNLVIFRLLGFVELISILTSIISLYHFLIVLYHPVFLF